MRLNKVLLRKIATKLRRLRHEEHYDQGRWFDRTPCGTAACIAGYIALEKGYRPLTEQKAMAEGLLGERSFFCQKGKTVLEVSDVAGAALGMDEDEAQDIWLFDAAPRRTWPEPYRGRWAAAKAGTSKERPSRIAADVLDAIADGKVEL